MWAGSPWAEGEAHEGKETVNDKMMKKIVVPEGMLKAAERELSLRITMRGDVPCIPFEKCLEAALRWLVSDVLTPESRRIFDVVQSKMKLSWRSPGDDSFCSMLDYLERRFVAPEPEVPEAVKVLLLDEKIPNADFSRPTRRFFNDSILEAYRRGKEGK
jgi:hypothetical protein